MVCGGRTARKNFLDPKQNFGSMSESFADPPEPDETPADELGPARGIIITATRLGHAALDREDYRGAHEIFSCALRTILRGKLASPRLMEPMETALDQADIEPDARLRASILGDMVTELLGERLDDPEDDEGEPIQRIQQVLAWAISLGAQAYNLGLHRGCYEVYAAAARMVAVRWPQPTPVHAQLKKAFDLAGAVPDESRKAWLMREAFDAILAMDPKPNRAKISHQEVRLLISMAIQIGAPAYNLGDRRGCYEIYAATARLLVRLTAEDDPQANLLRDVLQKAILEPDVTEQAWMLRRAFDAILALVDEPQE
jgi:hypothetical protein